MGFLDGLLGLSTNAAANKQTGIADKYRQAVGDSNDLTLRNYANLAQGDIQGYGTAASDVLNSTTGQAQSALTNGNATAQGLLTAGANAATGQVLGSNAAYAPYQANGAASSSMIANALGLNGASGNAAATGAFQASPGYQYQVDQATDAAARKAASLGMAGSGNTLSAITTLGSNLANQEWGGYLDRLLGQQGVGMQANNAVSGNNATAAGYDYGAGATGAGLAQQTGQGLANLSASLGTQQGSIFGAEGSALSNIATGLGNSLVNNATATANTVNNQNLTNANQIDNTVSHNNSIFSNLAGNAFGALKSTSTGSGLISSLMKL